MKWARPHPTAQVEVSQGRLDVGNIVDVIRNTSLIWAKTASCDPQKQKSKRDSIEVIVPYGERRGIEDRMVKEVQQTLDLELKRKGADVIRFADLSSLSTKINRGFSKGILIGILLSKEFITNLYETIQTDFNEFNEKEHKADELAEWTAEYLQKQGFKAFAQSEENIGQNGYFNMETKASTLPHKTIALLAGLGWIGKNDLLINQDYGCAICMCSVLTDAPIDVITQPLVGSMCGNCDICKKICPTNAILGNVWSKNSNRDMLVDVFRCECCLKCLSCCPWTVNYTKKKR